MLTAAILAKNEQDSIATCLSSLSFCDEIIVIDDESSDNTAQIAKQFNALVYPHPLNNDFAAQHNFALEKARGDWVLFIDADEIVPPALQKEVSSVLSDPLVNGYRLRRLDYFIGQKLPHGETGYLSLLRLGRKNSGHWVRPVHEYWKINGPVKILSHPLDHHSHSSIFQFVSSINYHTSIDAGALISEGKTFSLFRTITNPLAKFAQNYIFRLGFLDGLPGFVMAFMMSFYSLTVRVKQYDLASSS